MFITGKSLGNDRLFHGFFGRNGGVSRGIYRSLNCGYGSDDRPEYVQENRRRIAEAAGFPEAGLVTVNQCHSALSVTLQQPWRPDQGPQADAMVTDRAGVLLGVLTADCAPILLSGKKKDGSAVIGAAHAGWRGAFGGIITSVVAGMVQLGAQPETLVACIGPCLGPQSYEVDPPFRDHFLSESNNLKAFFHPAKTKDKFLFDLPSFVSERLLESGVESVESIGIDTFASENEYFSYRRTVHRNESDYGRQISVIGIKAGKKD